MADKVISERVHAFSAPSPRSGVGIGNRQSYFALTVLFVFIGAALRLAHLNDMRDLLDYDEAFYGIDALSLLKQPRFTPFFYENHGRESLWMYVLTPALATLEARPFALRITAVMTGILTLAAVYALARELFDDRVATWTLATLAVLYWHVHLSHIAFRAILYPLVGSLALAYLLRAYRQSQIIPGQWQRTQYIASLQLWMRAGIFTGLLLYTYLAARVWVTFIFGLLILIFLRGQDRRIGSVLAAVTAGLIMLPLVNYLLTNPLVTNRLQTESVVSFAEMLNNARKWLNVWLYEGSGYYFHNLPGRPVLDLPLALLVAAGIVVLLRRYRPQALLILVLAGLSAAPSIASDEAPHYLRAFGLVVPVALIGGAGAAAVDDFVRRYGQQETNLTPRPPDSRRKVLLQTERERPELSDGSDENAPDAGLLRRFAVVIPALLLLWAGLHTALDSGEWWRTLKFPPMFQDPFDRIHTLLDYLSEQGYAEPDAPTFYYLPDNRDHPLIIFRLERWNAEPLGIYEFPDCTIGRPLPFVYAGALDEEPGLASRWATVSPLFRDPVVTAYGPGYGVFRVTAPDDVLLGESGGLMSLSLAKPLPEKAAPGQTLTLPFRLVPLRPMTRAYTLFVHLYPEAKTEVLTQTDAPLCPEFPPSRWYPDQAALVTRTLILPETLAPGTYRLVVGIYDSETLQRLSITGTVDDTLIAGELIVE